MSIGCEGRGWDGGFEGGGWDGIFSSAIVRSMGSVKVIEGIRLAELEGALL